MKTRNKPTIIVSSKSKHETAKIEKSKLWLVLFSRLTNFEITVVEMSTVTSAISARYRMFTPARHISVKAKPTTDTMLKMKIESFVLSAFLVMRIGEIAVAQFDGNAIAPTVEVIYTYPE